MGSLTSLTGLLLAVAVLVVLAVWLGFMRMGPFAMKRSQELRLEDWQVRAMRPLTASELQALQLIRKALPECLLFPQIALARFINVGQSKSYSQWFTAIGRRTVDFLICSEQGDVLGVIHLHSNKSKAFSEGTQRKLKALEWAQIPVWILATDDLPDAVKLRSLVIPELQASLLHSIQHPDPEWEATRLELPRELAPVARKPEALASKPGRWNQIRPTEEARSSDFLDEWGMIEVPPLVVKGRGRSATGFTRD
jgi:Protein of unknown function (DUF2726)